MSVKFIHTADWQIGKPFARIEDDNKRFLVQNQRIKTIESIAAEVEKTNASFVVVAGDLFDSNTADKPTVSAACSAIGKIKVPVIAIPGNHDHGGPGSVWQQDYFLQEKEQLAPNLTVLLEYEPFEIDDVVIFPCPLLRRHESQDCTAWLRDDHIFQSFQGKTRLVLAHGSVHGFTSESDGEEGPTESNRISIENLPMSEIDYCALGDWHGGKKISEKVWYSGTPELDRFPKSGSHNPGNILVVEASRNKEPVVEIVQSSKLQWSSMSYHFAKDDDLDLFQKELNQLIESRANEDLLRLILSGSLGIEAYSKLVNILDTLEARLLRLKLSNQTMIAPTDAEIEGLTQRSNDPVLSMVANQLVNKLKNETDPDPVTATALRELYGAINQRGAV
ncbi:metallophosphoesterase family protein [Desulfonatronovibrio magnus]|uniref:metallophosphoesterase family protein n=1 Tax=Desulfonatronovibrio magnus TaxID=698827 RepID=UPI0005EB7FD8|nr:DNA repair exonuclease [Desulfonatronovibrio magnus]